MVNTLVDQLSAEAQNPESLGRCSIVSYGAGHMLNDITSSCWFTYLLLFLTDIGLSPSCLVVLSGQTADAFARIFAGYPTYHIIEAVLVSFLVKQQIRSQQYLLESWEAAIVMLSGQTADAFATVFAGEMIDRFGHFKLWHAGGSILVAISFSSVFGGCLPCKILGTNSASLETIGYSIFAAIFNVGWAVTQVSHMSMVTCITLNSTSRVALASCRNAFTMAANLSLYAVAFAVFSFYNSKASVSIKIQYRWIAYLSIFIGCCFVGLFLFGTKEPELKQQMHLKNHSRISSVHWFKKVLYYQVALVYMLTRLVTNVSQAFLVFYVIDDLEMDHSSKALVPALIYICSFTVSVILQEIKWTGWRLKVSFATGAILWIFSGIGIFILPSTMQNFMFVLSISVGVANALMTVTCISMQSILVGKDLNGCAFVYGSLSFVDKLSCGLALYALESFQVSPSVLCHNGIRSYLSISRFGSGLIPASCALLSAVVTYTMELQDTTYSRTLVEPFLV